MYSPEHCVWPSLLRDIVAERYTATLATFCFRNSGCSCRIMSPPRSHFSGYIESTRCPPNTSDTGCQASLKEAFVAFISGFLLSRLLSAKDTQTVAGTSHVDARLTR